MLLCVPCACHVLLMLCIQILRKLPKLFKCLDFPCKGWLEGSYSLQLYRQSRLFNSNTYTHFMNTIDLSRNSLYSFCNSWVNWTWQYILMYANVQCTMNHAYMVFVCHLNAACECRRSHNSTFHTTSCMTGSLKWYMSMLCMKRTLNQCVISNKALNRKHHLLCHPNFNIANSACD